MYGVQPLFTVGNQNTTFENVNVVALPDQNNDNNDTVINPHFINLKPSPIAKKTLQMPCVP